MISSIFLNTNPYKKINENVKDVILIRYVISLLDILSISTQLNERTPCIHLHSLLYSSSHVKNSFLFSQFLKLRRLCSDESDFFYKSESMCQFFEKRGYPLSVVQEGTAPNLLINSQHYKRHRREILTAFYSLSHFTPTTTQLNPLFFKTFNYFKTIQRLVLSFRNHHSSHLNATKT